MKNSIYLLIILFVGLFQSCKKEKELTVLKAVSFSSLLTANKSAVVLSAATDTSSVVTFSWPAVTFPVKASVTYTLEVDVPADTVGAAAWGNATSIAIGDDILSKSYNGKDLNVLALSMGIGSGAAGSLVFRVKAYQDRAAYSKAISLNVTTYLAQAVYPLL
jgi:hypothetical protein